MKLLNAEHEVYCIETAMQYARHSDTWKKYLHALEHMLKLQLKFLMEPFSNETIHRSNHRTHY